MPQCNSRTDLVLYSLAHAGWLDDYTGMEEAPTGAVYLLQKVDKMRDVVRTDLVGDFLVREYDDAPVEVQRFNSQQDALQAFAAAKKEYLAW
jgi:hypothetical protein